MQQLAGRARQSHGRVTRAAATLTQHACVRVTQPPCTGIIIAVFLIPQVRWLRVRAAGWRNAHS